MAKRKKMPTDLNQRAKAIVDFATSDEPSPIPMKVRTWEPWSVAAREVFAVAKSAPSG